MKIASMKNEIPSSAKPTPNTSPNVAMKFGHSRPNSNDRIVPVTTPTAKIVSATLDQRLASALYVTSPVRRYRPCTNRNIAGKAIPKQTIGMCTASDSACIRRASSASGAACSPSAPVTRSAANTSTPGSGIARLYVTGRRTRSATRCPRGTWRRRARRAGPRHCFFMPTIAVASAARPEPPGWSGIWPPPTRTSCSVGLCACWRCWLIGSAMRADSTRRSSAPLLGAGLGERLLQAFRDEPHLGAQLRHLAGELALGDGLRGEDLGVHGLERRDDLVHLPREPPEALPQALERLVLRRERGTHVRIVLLLDPELERARRLLMGEELDDPLRAQGVRFDRGDKLVDLVLDVEERVGGARDRGADRSARLDRGLHARTDQRVELARADGGLAPPGAHALAHAPGLALVEERVRRQPEPARDRDYGEPPGVEQDRGDQHRRGEEDVERRGERVDDQRPAQLAAGCRSHAHGR